MDVPRHVPLADPFVFAHKGWFYLYGTNDAAPDEGLPVWRSRDMLRWEELGMALRRGDAYGRRGFWAGCVLARGGKFYILYTANEQLAVAVADSPAGPFRGLSENWDPMPGGGDKEIDADWFVDTDGAVYIVFVRLGGGNRIFIARMKDDLSGYDISTARECIKAELPWENASDANWPVVEAGSLHRRGDVYYLIYTANDFRNPKYAIGYATGPTPFGPWTRFSGNPIQIEAGDVHGTGCGQLIKAGRQLYMVFHAHAEAGVFPRRTARRKARFVKQGVGLPDRLELYGDLEFMMAG